MSSSDTPKVVLLRGDPLALERNAGVANILPGHSLVIASDGDLEFHGAAGPSQVLLVAREEEYVGGSLETAYANGDRIPYYVGRKGDQFYMLLAASQTAAPGTLLANTTTGVLTPAGGSPANAVARALEDKVAGSGGPARVRVEVI